ncbi:MAG TPA: hypothetical protein VFP61_08370 [Acidimicrobiales bacterium]|nr:hypothetical protein [Acidimicrobiales bacterium]
MTSPYDTLWGGDAPVVVDPRRDVVRVAGPDATTFLQGQCSQDLAAVDVGASAWSWVLQPTGKVDALVRATRLDADTWLLDTDTGWAEPLVARLVRFRLRTRVDVEQLDRPVVGLRGGGLADVRARAAAEGAVAAAATWGGLAGVDLIGGGAPSAASPTTGAAVADAGDWEAVRVEIGFPRMGAELTERTIPGETGLVERTVSFTKGCYTGQELVARIDSRGGNVPRRLVGLRLDGPMAAGSELRSADGGAGATLTSVARSPRLGVVALGYTRRGVEVGAVLHADGVAGEVVELPMAR